jgi:hypothetical protein
MKTVLLFFFLFSTTSTTGNLTKWGGRVVANEKKLGRNKTANDIVSNIYHKKRQIKKQKLLNLFYRSKLDRFRGRTLKPKL